MRDSRIGFDLLRQLLLGKGDGLGLVLACRVPMEHERFVRSGAEAVARTVQNGCPIYRTYRCRTKEPLLSGFTETRISLTFENPAGDGGSGGGIHSP